MVLDVVVMRYKSHGERFEVPCHRSKLEPYVSSGRGSPPERIDDILLEPRIYFNAHKGSFANNKSLISAFGTEDASVIASTIVQFGDAVETEKDRSNKKQSEREMLLLMEEAVQRMLTNRFTGVQPTSAEIADEFKHLHKDVKMYVARCSAPSASSSSSSAGVGEQQSSAHELDPLACASKLAHTICCVRDKLDTVRVPVIAELVVDKSDNGNSEQQLNSIVFDSCGLIIAHTKRDMEITCTAEEQLQELDLTTGQEEGKKMKKMKKPMHLQKHILLLDQLLLPPPLSSSTSEETTHHHQSQSHHEATAVATTTTTATSSSERSSGSGVSASLEKHRAVWWSKLNAVAFPGHELFFAAAAAKKSQEGENEAQEAQEEEEKGIAARACPIHQVPLDHKVVGIFTQYDAGDPCGPSTTQHDHDTQRHTAAAARSDERVDAAERSRNSKGLGQQHRQQDDFANQRGGGGGGRRKSKKGGRGDDDDDDAPQQQQQQQLLRGGGGGGFSSKYEKMTLKVLQDLCHKHNLSSGGKKSALIDRLEAYDETSKPL